MFTFIFVIFIIYLSFTNYDVLVSSVISSLSNFILLLIPSLFLMIILVNLLSNNNIVLKIIKVLHVATKKVFGFTSEKETFIFFFSLFCGSSTTAVTINNAFENNEISENSANRLITHLSFPSPLYLYKTTLVYGSKIQFIIVFSLYFIPLLFLGFSKCYSFDFSLISKPYDKSLFTIIEDAFFTLLKVLSFILFFSMLINLIFSEFHFTNNIKYVISNTIELTIGGSYRFTSSMIYELFLLILFNNFLGLSLIFQIKSIFKQLNIRSFILKRILISILSGLFGILLYLNINYIFTLIIFLVFIFIRKVKKSSQI